jgi:opacity protein-like surface antigen
MDKWYLGGEIGGGFTGVKGSLATGELEKKNYYNGQARIGYKATDSLMAYGVIGLEGAEFDANGQSERDWAYKYGVGVETFVKDNISIRGQVDYVDWQGDNGLPGEPEWRTTLGAAYHF